MAGYREGPYHYRIAQYLNTHPGDLQEFVETANSLDDFAKVFDMLKPRVRALAVKFASRIITKTAKQIADTGYRSGKLKIVKGFPETGEIDLDRSLEYFMDEPERGILDNLATYNRLREKSAFVIMIDHSYSMRGLKIVLAAITAATIAYHFKTDFSVLAFSNKVKVLKAINHMTGPEKVVEQLFDLKLQGDTNVRLALEEGLKQVSDFTEKKGLILTDGSWNTGGNPLDMAAKYDKLNVIGFPPANPDKVKLLSNRGKGEFAFVETEKQIANAIIKCIN
ncbi:VWA domain-containing protein [Thermincola ferriacetica]